MIQTYETNKIDVIILCGGFGKRLMPIISDKPKVLAKIRDKVFLDIIIENILSYGFKNIILCIGHLKDKIKEHYNYINYINCNIIYSEEDQPLGTGGALKNAQNLINNDPFIVMNGDSICDINFINLINFHINKNALLSMVLSEYISPNSTLHSYGNVDVDKSQRIINFNEKSSYNRNNKLINGGIYVMQKEIFNYMPQNNFSLEYHLFPKIIDEHRCYGFLTDKMVIDIGTPERYKKAIELIK